MIFDRLENKACYTNAHPLLAKAFEFLEEYNKNPLAAGNYEIVGTDLFAKVLHYETKPEGKYETHRKYIDIQYMVEGSERVYYRDTKDDMIHRDEYNEVKDVIFYQDSTEDFEFVLTPGRFAIFFPEDVHKPSISVNQPEAVKKIVLKVLI